MRPTQLRRTEEYVVWYHTWLWGFTTGYQRNEKNLSNIGNGECCRIKEFICVNVHLMPHFLGLIPVICLIYLNTRIYRAMKTIKTNLNNNKKKTNIEIKGQHSIYCKKLQHCRHCSFHFRD